MTTTDDTISISLARSIASQIVDRAPAGAITIEEIAEQCHAANVRYSVAIADGMTQSWEVVRQSVIDGVVFRLTNPDSTPEQSHENWLKFKTDEGWTYGPAKDADKKEHPCFLPYAELPEAQRAKDLIFTTVVDGLKVRLRKDVYEAKSDARQMEMPKLADEHKLFRKRYRQLGPTEVSLHDQIKDKADELAALFYQVSPIHIGPDASRERGANITLAVRHLEDAVYRAVKGLTS